MDIALNTFIAGLADQLVGAGISIENGKVDIDFPPDFVTKELAGKKGVFEVEIVEVKVKFLPPVDDALCENFTVLKIWRNCVLACGVDLENELKYSQTKAVRSQLVNALLAQSNFDLPESAVAHETKRGNA